MLDDVASALLWDAHFGGGIGRDGKLPVHRVAVYAPAALYETMGER